VSDLSHCPELAWKTLVWHASVPATREGGVAARHVRREGTAHGQDGTPTARRATDDRGALRREAMNYPIQGAASDISRLALACVSEELRDLDARLINSIHDEFVVECAEDIAPEVSARTKRAMVRAGEDILEKVPVEVAISREWQK
jgi:DNA polymerase I-like protein with 3'-5' exonuclease and polymerase domains